jgi:histone chaperone ASF1
MLMSCSYREKEFIRVGYYVNNDYCTEELREYPPAVPDLTQIQRHILAEKPRVTRFAIPWDGNEVVQVDTQVEQEGEIDDDDAMMDDDDHDEQGVSDEDDNQSMEDGSPQSPLKVRETTLAMNVEQ